MPSISELRAQFGEAETDEMTPAVEQVVTEEPVVDEVVDEPVETPDAPTYSEVEREAMAAGWNPDGVEGKRKLSAEEYLDRKPIYDRIHHLEDTLKKSQDKFKVFNQKFAELEAKAILEAEKKLRSEKREALADDDPDRVMEIDEEILTLRDRKAALAAETTAAEEVIKSGPTLQEVFNTWTVANPWYTQHENLREEADALGMFYMQGHPEASQVEVLTHVSETIRKHNADYFANPNRKAPPKVAGPSQRGSTVAVKTKHTAADLDHDMRSMMKEMLKGSTMTEAEYIGELERIGYFTK